LAKNLKRRWLKMVDKEKNMIFLKFSDEEVELINRHGYALKDFVVKCIKYGLSKLEEAEKGKRINVIRRENEKAKEAQEGVAKNEQDTSNNDKGSNEGSNKQETVNDGKKE
jgi:hypothetical protein